MAQMTYDVYIAGPLFTEAEKDFNLKVCSFLQTAGLVCYLPQLWEAAGGTDYSIASRNLNALMNSSCILAICDGADVDSGTAWEIGAFFANRVATGKAGDIVLLKTDTRGIREYKNGINLQIGEYADRIYNTISGAVGYLKDYKFWGKRDYDCEGDNE